jgi:peptidoglycan/LPS O-acetylase OafA/YrhL
VPKRLFVFLIRRAFRIFPLFWAAILLDWSLGRISLEHVTNSFFLLSSPNHFWAVPVEFQYYLLIPIIASGHILLTDFPRLYVLCLAILMTGVLILAPGVALSPFLPCFLMGSLLAMHLPVIAERLNEKLLLILIFFGLGIVVISIPSVMRFTGLDYILNVDVLRNNSTMFGVVFFPLIAGAVTLPAVQAVFSGRFLYNAGKISFSVYLLHPLAIDLLTFWQFSSPLAAWVVLLMAIVLGFLGYVLVEKPIRTIGYRLTAGGKAVDARLKLTI